MNSVPSKSNSSISFKSKKPLLCAITPKKHPPPSPSPSPSPSSSVFTPERVDLHNRNRNQKSAALLPEKYEMLCELFNAMVSSIQLFKFKRMSTTFSKLKCNVESLTDRRFTLHHLAQLKHIMPEVILVQKVRVQDEKTNCMKEDLMIKLEMDAMEVDKNLEGPSGFSRLKGIFMSRMTEYTTTHLEVDDIPEGELPQLFWQAKLDPKPSMIKTPTSLAASHLSPTFKSRFSCIPRASISESSSAKPSFSLLETPIKAASSKVEDDPSCHTPCVQGTPMALTSTPANLIDATPALRPPKRSVMSPDYHIDESNNKVKRSRSLKFDESDVDIEDQASKVDCAEDNVSAQFSIANKDILDILPESLLQSVRDNERRLLHEQDPVMLQARKRQQLMGSVPKLYDMICLLFLSIRRSFVTKEELIYKIVEGNLDIVDRKEVEEQLTLLQEIAPECVSEQMSLSGDIIIRLNKPSDPSLIRAKLTDSMQD